MPLRWRLRDGLATAVLWVLYLGLVRAAIEGVVDLLQGRITSLEGARVLAVAPTLIDYATFIAINGTVLIGWAMYNWVRFHGPDRRRSIAPVTPEAVALHFGADIDLPRTMAATRIGILRHDADGRILGFEPVVVEPSTRETVHEAVPAK